MFPSRDMADRDDPQLPADVEEQEMKPTNTSHTLQQGHTQDEKQQHPEDSAPSSASTNGEFANSNVEDLGQAVLEDTDSTGENMAPHTEGPSSDEPSTGTMKDDDPPPRADEGSHGDGSRETPGDEQLDAMGEEVSEKPHMEVQKEPPVQLDQGDRGDDQVDGPNASVDEEETPGTENTATDDVVNKSSLRGRARSQEDERKGYDQFVETIGPYRETSQPARGMGIYLLVLGVVVVVVAFLAQQLIQPESPPQEKDVRQIDIFLRHMEKLKTQFPHQRAELWSRSRIHMLKHLQTAQPTEPVSLILTAGVKAERTLRCLAQGLASAFSSALNASVLHIDGAGKASQDSDQVKLEIDSSLQGAFEGDKPVAVIHRFEELPPGSTLIFYRYCDHENAAYKKTCLIFTVLLEEEEEIPAKSRLNAVEEMVDDHLQKKFLSDGPIAFDRMDLDKYGGLWSRISHLILPVAAEETMEHEGC